MGRSVAVLFGEGIVPQGALRCVGFWAGDVNLGEGVEARGEDGGGFFYFHSEKDSGSAALSAERVFFVLSLGRARLAFRGLLTW